MNVTLLDYGAGNVRSVRNALARLGYSVCDVAAPEDILHAEKLIFPGVGSFGLVMERLRESGYVEPLRQRILADKPFLGICVALQALFEGSEESPGVAGLGILPGQVRRFQGTGLAVPQIGWNSIKPCRQAPLFQGYAGEKLYFVHSYHATLAETDPDWLLAVSDYGAPFVAAVGKGRVNAFQFHPEKSGACGLAILERFLNVEGTCAVHSQLLPAGDQDETRIARRIIACLDVRSNDAGDLVVTKGDQYDVRESGEVRNLGKPVELAKRYYEEGADEITFLNITGFRAFPLEDQPMLEVLARTSENVFVPLTIGGGIRQFTDATGVYHSALDVASAYFRAGADKISIGSDAVLAVEEYLATGHKSGQSAIEQISAVYGAQAVVISVDPRRVYVSSPDETGHTTIKTAFPGPKNELYCWYQCTIKGGREGRDVDVVQLVQSCARLGAGEILLNCIDRDGTGSGFDLELISLVKASVSIPVIASSGAGSAAHFVEVFSKTATEAALAAGIFHRREVSIAEVKEAVRRGGIETR
jgi:imidazole glycerol-phosphate synthase